MTYSDSSLVFGENGLFLSSIGTTLGFTTLILVLFAWEYALFGLLNLVGFVIALMILFLKFVLAFLSYLLGERESLSVYVICCSYFSWSFVPFLISSWLIRCSSATLLNFCSFFYFSSSGYWSSSNSSPSRVLLLFLFNLSPKSSSSVLVVFPSKLFTPSNIVYFLLSPVFGVLSKCNFSVSCCFKFTSLLSVTVIGLVIGTA